MRRDKRGALRRNDANGLPAMPAGTGSTAWPGPIRPMTRPALTAGHGVTAGAALPVLAERGRPIGFRWQACGASWRSSSMCSCASSST
jgi:hypothetical protein